MRQVSTSLVEELSQQNLTGAERLAIARQYLAGKDALEEEYASDSATGTKRVLNLG
jgi:hypothetical protein